MGIGRYRSYQFFLRRIWGTFSDLQIYGRELMVEDGPLVIATNHASFFDPMLLGTIYRRPLSFIARESLFSNTKFSAFIRDVFAFPLRRGTSSKDALRMFEERLKRKMAVVLFPEGTRSNDGKFIVSESAIGMLAVRNNTPVQPLYLMGTWHSWNRQQTYPRFRPIRVYVAPAIYPKQNMSRYDKRDEQHRINREYLSAIVELEKRAWAEYPAFATTENATSS